MDIQIQRGVSLGKDRPESVHILMIDSKGNTKATVEVYPVLEVPPFTDTFRVEVRKLGRGGIISPEIDIRLSV